MRTLSDLHKRILKEEYPNINLESDSDVERYFELRAIGRQSEALSLYNNKIKTKYPNDEQRTLLIKYYRSHDSRFYQILHNNLVLLAERIIARTTYIISLLTKEIDKIDITDAYSVIKLVESLLSIISPDRYVAITFTEKYVRYAKRLDFKYTEMEQTAELIRMYVTETIDSVENYKREKESNRKEYIRNKAVKKLNKPHFNLSQIVFSQTDISRITISSRITRTEDIVLSYCLKYWHLVNDTAFEKKIFLFSKKYKTKNYDIFQAIKNGRLHNWKDEEILNSVLANVVSGYYYNINGDLYIQREWSRLKILKVQADDPIQKPLAHIYKPMQEKQKTAKHIIHKYTKKKIIPFKVTKIRLQNQEIHSPRTLTLQPNSIADMIKKITGKTYTVYKDLFFQSIRTSIRNTLTTSKQRKGTLFDTKQNETEDIIYNFLFANFNNPYQNWKESSDQKKTIELGYRIMEIDPIIVHWVRNNQKD